MPPQEYNPQGRLPQVEPSPEVCVRIPTLRHGFLQGQAVLRVRASEQRFVRHTDAGRQEDFGGGLVQATQAINQVNNNANGKGYARFLPTLKELGFLAQFL